MEIAVPRSGWEEVQTHLDELEFRVADDGRLWLLDQGNLDRTFQTWGLDDQGIARVDVFREPHEGETRICRRHEAIRRSYATVLVLTGSGIPYRAPEIVLLFKAKNDRDKDRHDLQAALPLMDAERRAWLGASLRFVLPGHPWLRDLQLG